MSRKKFSQHPFSLLIYKILYSFINQQAELQKIKVSSKMLEDKFDNALCEIKNFISGFKVKGLEETRVSSDVIVS